MGIVDPIVIVQWRCEAAKEATAKLAYLIAQLHAEGRYVEEREMSQIKKFFHDEILDVSQFCDADPYDTPGKKG